MSKGKSGLAAPSKALDPSLTALFASSSGPAVAPSKQRYTELSIANAKPKTTARIAKSSKATKDESSAEDEDQDAEDSEEDEDESVSGSAESEEGEDSGEALEVDGEDAEDVSEAEQSDSSDDNASESAAATEAQDAKTRKRKRKAAEDNADLESKYFQRLAETDEPSEKRPRMEKASADRDKTQAEGDDSDSELPVHESLTKDKTEADLDKAARTVFLSNVTTDAITSRSAKKTLMAHLSTVLDKSATPPQTIESLRFRSVAFSGGSLPKRAAYITGALMDATTKSANAYVVYSTPAAARAAVSKLNGTVVLDRHLRADSVAHPAAVAHRRCVFVGNLGFVDDETVLSTKVDAEGNKTTETRKRTKIPMDVEEGLWRTFGKHAGKVESVRVVRDEKTRVGKGIAYVQFYDENSVEAALLLSGKKYPPMLPRELRVTRCKAPHKTARAMERTHKAAPKGRGAALDKKGKSTGYVAKPTPDSQTLAGRAGKLLGRSAAHAAARGDRGGPKRAGGKGALPGGRRDREANGRGFNTNGETGAVRPPESFVFEGRRASAKDGKPSDLRIKGARVKKNRKEPSGNKKRQAERVSKWKSQKKSE